MPEQYNLNGLASLCHGRALAAGWYTDPATGVRLDRNVGEMLAFDPL